MPFPNAIMSFPDAVMPFPDAIMSFPDAVMSFPDAVMSFPDAVMPFFNALHHYVAGVGLGGGGCDAKLVPFISPNLPLMLLWAMLAGVIKG